VTKLLTGLGIGAVVGVAGSQIMYHTIQTPVIPMQAVADTAIGKAAVAGAAIGGALFGSYAYHAGGAVVAVMAGFGGGLLGGAIGSNVYLRVAAS
jgi:hypothetical protein